MPRGIARQALSDLIDRFTDSFTGFDEAVDIFADAFQQACEAQSDALSGVRAPGVVTDSERQCSTAIDRILAEANRQIGFTDWFVQWSNRNGFSLADLGIPQAVINFLSPENSLTIAFEKASADAQCSQWWDSAQTYQCGVP